MMKHKEGNTKKANEKGKKAEKEKARIEEAIILKRVEVDDANHCRKMKDK